MLIFLGGCQVMEKEEAGGEMLEYSIVDEKKVPAEMTERIAGMEETPFQIMYVQGDRLYVGQGYGRQEMEGYAIRVDGCTEEKDVICVQTTLLGPGSDETEKDVHSGSRHRHGGDGKYLYAGRWIFPIPICCPGNGKKRKTGDI